MNPLFLFHIGVNAGKSFDLIEEKQRKTEIVLNKALRMLDGYTSNLPYLNLLFYCCLFVLFRRGVRKDASFFKE